MVGVIISATCLKSQRSLYGALNFYQQPITGYLEGDGITVAGSSQNNHGETLMAKLSRPLPGQEDLMVQLSANHMGWDMHGQPS